MPASLGGRSVSPLAEDRGESAHPRSSWEPELPSVKTIGSEGTAKEEKRPMFERAGSGDQAVRFDSTPEEAQYL